MESQRVGYDRGFHFRRADGNWEGGVKFPKNWQPCYQLDFSLDSGTCFLIDLGQLISPFLGFRAISFFKMSLLSVTEAKVLVESYKLIYIYRTKRNKSNSVAS